MPDVIPRFEFRAFAQQFGQVEDRIRGLGTCERIRESCETYIVSSVDAQSNTKVRDQLMDIKVLLRRDRELEQWMPRLKAAFPLPADLLVEQVFPAFGVPAPTLQRAQYTLAQLLEELVRPHPQLASARVFKRRFGFTVNGCTTELAELLVNGAAIRTTAVEAEDAERVLDTRKWLGLGEYENVSYPLALKRILGMEPTPSREGADCWSSAGPPPKTAR